MRQPCAGAMDALAEPFRMVQQTCRRSGESSRAVRLPTTRGSEIRAVAKFTMDGLPLRLGVSMASKSFTERLSSRNLFVN